LQESFTGFTLELLTGSYQASDLVPESSQGSPRVSGDEDGMQSWRLTTGPFVSWLALAVKCGEGADSRR
jgi:hypothetical protein